jgi:hypothetical protein
MGGCAKNVQRILTQKTIHAQIVQTDLLQTFSGKDLGNVRTKPWHAIAVPVPTGQRQKLSVNPALLDIFLQEERKSVSPVPPLSIQTTKKNVSSVLRAKKITTTIAQTVSRANTVRLVVYVLTVLGAIIKTP